MPYSFIGDGGPIFIHLSLLRLQLVLQSLLVSDGQTVSNTLHPAWDITNVSCFLENVVPLRRHYSTLVHTSVSLAPCRSLASWCWSRFWLLSPETQLSISLLRAFLRRVSAPTRGEGGGREGLLSKFSLGLRLCFCTGQFWLPLWQPQSTLY